MAEQINKALKSAVLEMKGLSKVFETDELQTYALRSIELKVYSGEYLSISGPSGCGKSTLLSILGLLDMPTSGEYFIDGVNVSKLTLNQAAEIRNAKIGFIFQSFNLIDELSVFDNVALPLRYHHSKPSKHEIAEKVKACLEKVGLGHRMSHKPSQLSGGQQQRVAIARALVAEPTILLVDEPTGNLDSKSGDQVMQILTDLNNGGTTICMVTHDPRYADMASRQLKLLDGELLGEIAVKEPLNA
ncbi:putative ABC transport system ATP-binding protein [Pseudoalteromonas espejiana DSM 9414]|uniref:ABC transporter ATP-binding protein n=1 Tax=Pseudoalteromonas espejiana TaxID=28107 RepID=A0A510XY80_9GAMM|nr:ABC transporter ATP-binding protein [Pseudoalteromonas espejiana]ASM49002.1 putative ABC transport system ATP-binding protein [Pseudoalteromonas espejiana DSM 9414]GEK55972.1 ABC transporter ATP-binding protein [Pseudoalteromonas espejiana]